MTGRSFRALSSFMILRNSRPFILGIFKSRSITEGFSLLSSLRYWSASSPLLTRMSLLVTPSSLKALSTILASTLSSSTSSAGLKFCILNHLALRVSVVLIIIG